MKKILSYILITFLAGFFVVSCSDDDDNDNNDNNNNNTPTGILHVYVRKDNTSGVYIGNAEVYIYKTKADRNANSYLKYNLTGTNPSQEPAILSDLEFNADESGKYYIKAERQITGKMYMGLSEVLVPVNTTTSHHIAIIEQ